MDVLVDLSWRAYPAALLMAIGFATAGVGIGRGITGLRLPIRTPNKSLFAIRGFRLAVVGLALTGIAAAWVWHLTWLLVLALAIGGEELLESTLIIFALTKGRDLRLRVPGT